MEKKKIIFADTNTLFAKALCFLLEREDARFKTDIKDDASASSVREILNAGCDALVIHQRTPDAGTVRLMREARRRRKRLRVLFIVSEATGDLISLAGESQSIGIMSERTEPSEFIRGLAAVTRGERYISEELLKNLGVPAANRPANDALRSITPREREVLYWIAHGMSNGEIADKLILSEKTVKNHVSHILKKLDITDRTKAAAIAWSDGMAQVEEEFFAQ